jgi:hypothetical protein
MKAARAADRSQAQKGARLGPLHGVPITLKEAFDVAGCAPRRAIRRSRTTSPDRRQPRGAPARGGAVILGKTNVPELCADFQTDSPLFGTHEERWDAGARPAARPAAAPSRWRRAVAARTRQRHRRLGAQSRALQRHLLPEAHRVARARPRPRARPSRPDADHALHGCSGRWRARSRISRRRCASSPDPTATKPRRRRCPLGPTPPQGGVICAFAVLESGSAGPGVRLTPPPSFRRTASCLEEPVAKVKRAEPAGFDWRQGLIVWDRSFSVP